MLRVAIGHSLVVRLNNVERIEEKNYPFAVFFCVGEHFQSVAQN
jgi:hypothetical protein